MVKLEHEPADRECPHCGHDLEGYYASGYRLHFRKCIKCMGDVANGLNADNTGNVYYASPPRKSDGA